MKPRPSIIVLLGVNMIPIAGVVLFEWRVFDILMLYWAENVVIGLINLLRMAACKGDIDFGHANAAIDAALQDAPENMRRAFNRFNSSTRLFMMPFFALHYGMFCWAHLSGVLMVSGPEQRFLMARDVIFGDGLANPTPLWIGVAAIAASHLFSFFTNFIGSGEYQRTNLKQLMHRPYGRIIALHIAIIAGGALVQFLGEPLLMLIVLVIAKTAMDVKFHTIERRKFGQLEAGPAEPTRP